MRMGKEGNEHITPGATPKNQTVAPTSRPHMTETQSSPHRSGVPFFILRLENSCANKPQNTHVSYCISDINNIIATHHHSFPFQTVLALFYTATETHQKRENISSAFGSRIKFLPTALGFP